MLAVLPKKDLDHFLPGEDGRWWDAGCSGWARCSATRPTRHPEAREPDWRMMDWKFLILEFSFWNPILHVGQSVVTAHWYCEIGFCLNQNRSKHIVEGTLPTSWSVKSSWWRTLSTFPTIWPTSTPTWGLNHSVMSWIHALFAKDFGLLQAHEIWIAI